MNSNIKYFLLGVFLMIILIAGYLGYNYLDNKIFQQGYNQGRGEMIIYLNQNQVFPVLCLNEETGNVTRKDISVNFDYKQVCENIK